MKKIINSIIIATVSAFALFTGYMFTIDAIHYNNVDTEQVVQHWNGKVEVVRHAGYFYAAFARCTVYQKGFSYYFSNDVLESKEHDAPSVRYANTGKGDLNCQVVYRLDWGTDDQIIKMHEIVHGDDTIIEQRVLATIKNVAQSSASKLNSTDAIRRYDEFTNTLKARLINNKELQDTMAINIIDFILSGEPDFDDKTLQLFGAQQEADLMKQTAEAEKIKFISERDRAVAQYEKETAENEGKARAKMAQDVVEAERIKKLAEIEASKKVAVEKLAKEQMLIQVSKEKEVAEVNAEKERTIAEIAKRTEAENLERVKLQSEQMIAKANAKKEAITLAGDITEAERVRLTIDKETKIGVAQAYAEGIGKLKLPVVMNTNNGGDNGNTTETGTSAALNTFLNLKNAAIALEIADTQNTTK